MHRHYYKFLTMVPVAMLGLAGLAGCGDDTDDTKGGDTAADGGPADGGGRAGTGGKAASGSAGKSGAGGKGDAGGKSSQAGAGGTAESNDGDDGGVTDAPSGAAGTPAAGSGGAGGSAGAPAINYPELSNIKASVIPSINALSAVTFATDGKFYAAGDINIIDDTKATGATAADKYRSSTTGHKVAVRRYNADGTLDKTFGTEGQATWEGPDGEATTMGLAETDDGSVVVDINVRQPSKRVGVALIKLDKAGKLVETFGTSGRVDLVFGWTDADVADYPKDAMGTVRYPSDQSWDIKSSNGGKQLVVFASGPAAHGLLDSGVTPPVQRIDNDRYIVRVNASDGAIDPGFNGGKVVVVHTPNEGATGDQVRYPSDGGRHGLVESDGSIVGAGYTGYNDGKGNHIVLIRLKPDGSFDPDFHKERAGQPVLPGVAVFNPVPEGDMGFAECYGVGHTAKGYVTTGYGMAFGGTTDKSSLGYLPSKSVDMVSSRFTGTAVDTTYGTSGVLAAQSEVLGDQKVSTFEDRGRSAVIALGDNRALMGGRFGDYPALFVVTEEGKFDPRIKGKQAEADGILLFPKLTSDKQPATSMFYGLALSPDGKHIVAGTNNHEQGAVLALLQLEDDGTITSVAVK